MIHPIVAGLVTAWIISLGIDLAKDIYYGLTAWFEKKAREKAERIDTGRKPNAIYVEVDAGHNREWTCTATNFDYETLQELYQWRLKQAQEQLKRRQTEYELNRRESNC